MERDVRLSFGDLPRVECVHDGTSGVVARAREEGAQDLFVHGVVGAARHGRECTGISNELVRAFGGALDLSIELTLIR